MSAHLSSKSASYALGYKQRCKSLRSINSQLNYKLTSVLCFYIHLTKQLFFLFTQTTPTSRHRRWAYPDERDAAAEQNPCCFQYKQVFIHSGPSSPLRRRQSTANNRLTIYSHILFVFRCATIIHHFINACNKWQWPRKYQRGRDTSL